MAKETIFSVSLSVDRKGGPRSPIWTVMKFEIVRQLKKPSFWIALLLMPLLMVGMIAISSLNSYNASEYATSGVATEGKTLGLYDEAGIVKKELLANGGVAAQGQSQTQGEAEATNLPEFTLVDSKDEGVEKIKRGELGVFYYIPADFSAEKPAEYYSLAKDTGLVANLETPLRAVLSASAMAETSPVNAVILSNSYKMQQTTFDEDGRETNLLGQAIIPLAVLAVFFILVCVFGNRLLMAVVEEKENRISEMILTAVSARDLIIGKIMALIMLGFLQMAVFVIPVVAMVIVNRNNPMIAGILDVMVFDLPTIFTNVLLLLFAYFFYVGASTLVGALVPTARDASQFIGPVIIGIMLPFYFMSLFMSGEKSLILYIFSYFPLSAPTALMLRNAFGSLPWYELIIGLVELAICSMLVIRLTVKTFQKNAINFSVVKLNFKPKKAWKKP